MPATSLRFKEAVYAQNTQVVFLVGITIDGVGLSSPIRIINNSTNIVYQGALYVGYPFKVNLPDDSPDTPSAATITIDNVDASIGKAIMDLAYPLSLLFEVFSIVDDVAYLECSYSGYLFTNITGDINTIEGNVSTENFFNEPFPGGTFTPSRFPGLFV